MQNILIMGSTGGIGLACQQILSLENIQMTGWTSAELDLNHPGRIFDKDLSDFDTVINCSGHSRGTYLGFMKNSWQNQLSQIMVNYVSNLFFLKHFAQSRKNGTYVWISSTVMDNARTFQSIYASSKLASKFAIDLIREEIQHIDVVEVKIGLVRTNFRYVNFDGARSKEEVSAMYDNEQCLDANTVAADIIRAIKNKQTEIFVQ